MELRDRGLYRVSARNFRVAVYRAATRTFLGLRWKFDAAFPFEEGPTVTPLRDLGETLPDDVVLDEFLPGGEFRANKPLAVWLEPFEEAAARAM